jgi:tungstate transport system ATP-binding protein
MKATAPTNDRLLEARDLKVVLGGRQILDIPAFEVWPNEILVIIGPNGSGKSTLVLSLGLLLKPATGRILFHGEPVENGSQKISTRRHFAMVFQEALLLDTTVWENVTLGLKLHGVKKSEMKDRAGIWLERFGIASLANRQAKTLSGGEAKRTSLARAFVLQPEILFLDEPFNALDTPTRQGLLEDFGNVLKETRTTTVMVTHDHNEALALADRLAVMIGGRVRQTGTPEEVFSFPADEGIAEFVEAGNILRGTVQEQNNGLALVNVGENRTIQAVSNLPSGTRVAMFIPYEDITVSVGDTGAVLSSARNQIKGTIIKEFHHGSQLKITLDCGFILSCLITRRSWEDLGLAVGREVVASFKASALHLIPKI